MTTWNSQSNNPGFVAQQVDNVLDDVIYEIHNPEPSAIVLHNNGQDQMIKITSDGFWVRGVQVPQDEHEAKTVYLAFKQWLAWANLQR